MQIRNVGWSLHDQNNPGEHVAEAVFKGGMREWEMRMK